MKRSTSFPGSSLFLPRERKREDPGNEVVKRLESRSNPPGIDLFADTAAILISIVPKDIMRCSGGKLICICPLGIP